MRPFAALVVAITVVLLAACGDSGSGDTEPVKTTPPAKALMCPEGSDFDANTLLGKEEKPAQSLAKKNGCDMRVTERDGEMFPMTMDFRPNRVNVVVADGKVSKVTGIG